MIESQVHQAARQWLEAGRLMGVPFTVLGPEAPKVDPAVAPVAAPAPAPAPAASRGPQPPVTAAAGPPDAGPGPRSDLPADPAAALADLAARYERQVAATLPERAFTHAVFGEGDPRASLMVVGDAPGAEEDRSGRPFVGPAGRKLEQMLAAIGLDRSAVYIATVVKIRPPQDRTPLQDEIDRCGPWMAAQIRVVRPRMILSLGATATRWLLGTEVAISRLRGVWGEWADVAAGEEALRIPVLPTFHPAYLLSNYTREVREQMWQDLQSVAGRLGASSP